MIAAPLANKTLAGSNFRKNFNAIVVAVLDRQTDRMQFNPTPEYRFRPGDTLIVLGSTDMIQRLRQEGCAA